jgi:hypothetical protein
MEHVHGVDIFDIYDIAYEPWWQQTWFFIVCGVSAVALVGIGIYLWSKYKKQPQLPYHIRIVHDLDELQKLIETPEMAHDFYCTLTDYLKQYLAYAFSLSSSLTDEELVSALKNRPDIPQFVIHAAHDILQGVEVIKFGRGTALTETMQKSLGNMKKIVEGTTFLVK